MFVVQHSHHFRKNNKLVVKQVNQIKHYDLVTIIRNILQASLCLMTPTAALKRSGMLCESLQSQQI